MLHHSSCVYSYRCVLLIACVMDLRSNPLQPSYSLIRGYYVYMRFGQVAAIREELLYNCNTTKHHDPFAYSNQNKDKRLAHKLDCYHM